MKLHLVKNFKKWVGRKKLIYLIGYILKGSKFELILDFSGY